ncbi:YihY/virulence factor BrkB family protein [Sphingomonas sp. KRR8]|uniref:YihY/virulence factor BrkB family protein n=1 Tax=Sphingomonas sp. KRR8 TaxID=2942996 RepID=UPI00202019A5|nr:YihY/virulence factor BrkB family protein [Sphingomonas sp. KRR8]URD60746.1 YihY/virulence factor BrkB family protein [Sphingomonas sp. KRR8]
MPRPAWKQIVARTWQRSWVDNASLVAAGVAFYSFLALVPFLGMLVLIYAMVADPSTVVSNMQSLTGFLPPDVARFVGEQLMRAVTTTGATKGTGVILALAFALYGGANGAGSIMTALNIAYHEEEKRSLSRFYLTALVITFCALLMALTALIATAAIAYLGKFAPDASNLTLLLGRAAAYFGLLCGAASVAATLYRFGPAREKARWAWITPGSLFTAVTWLLLTLAFGFYLTSIANYEATYGSLGAMIALLTWIYLSAYVLIVGAELNSEVEHQTRIDTTTGAPEPLGSRGAWAADNVVESSDPDREVASTGSGPSLGDAGPPLPAQDTRASSEGDLAPPGAKA